MRFFLLIILISFCLPCFAQTKTIQGEKLNLNSSVLNEHFKAWEIYSIPSTELQNRIQNQKNQIKVQLNLDNRHHWNLLLHPNDMRSSAYQVQLATGGISPRQENKAFVGYELSSSGKSVRLTIDENFIYGYIEKDNERWFIEPLHYFEPDAPEDVFVVYAEKNVIPKEGNQCGVTDMHNKTNELHQNYHHDHDDMPEAVGQCYVIELAIASDFFMFQKYGSVTNVENYTIGVMNNVQGNYDDEFADEIAFQIVTQFVSDCSTCDPWTASTSASTLLNSFRNWGNGGNFGVPFDVAQLWTDRNLDGSTIGIAFLGGVCTGSRYHVIQDFSSNANLIRVVTAHELGHNFDASHDSGTGFIMSPSVNNTSTWSAASVNVINAFITSLANSGNCVSSCAPPTPPTAGFGVSHSNICEGSTIQFFDQSQNNPIAWTWNFPGGQPSVSSDQNHIVTYKAPGSFNVTLTVTNANGADVLTQSGIVTVGTSGSAVLLYDSFEGGLGNWIVSNPDNSNTWSTSTVGGAVFGSTGAFMDNWSYNNGVGERDAIISPSISFEGVNNPVLQMDYAYALWSGNTSFNDSLIIYVSTDGGSNFTRVFQDADNGNGNFATTQPLPNEFTPADLADWCFGGGFGASCLSVDLTQFAGQQSVIIRIENFSNFGNNLFIDNVSVLSSCQILFPPVAGFTSSIPAGCTPHVVQYTDLSQNGPTNWSWQFPGGTPSTSTDQNPIVTYNTGGVYDVTLTVLNSAGVDIFNATNYVNVEDTPVASFTFTNVGSTFTFTNTSLGTGNYVWNFGDGNTSSQMNPVHTYATGGTYTVGLLVSNNCSSSTFVETITVVAAPTASFSASPLSGCGPLSVQFNDLSIGVPTQWSWDFPGGNPSTSIDQNPMVTYDNPGTYEVTLTASNPAGQNAFTITDYITVDPNATASFNSTINGNTVDFTNTSSNATSYSWDFGDGNSSTATSPTHTYSSDGTYTVSMTATNACGSVTSTETITISTAPTAAFSASATSGWFL